MARFMPSSVRGCREVAHILCCAVLDRVPASKTRHKRFKIEFCNGRNDNNPYDAEYVGKCAGCDVPTVA
jgi:hypothetical protein